MEEERELKQNYLRQEIVEKNYSPDEFMEYCEGIKGAEVDAYTFEELSKIVSDFILSKNQANDEIVVPDTFVEPPVQLSKPLESPFEVKEIKMNRESSAYSISAIKMHDNELSLEDVITVKVGK
jgi:hypothetical protein